MRRLAWRAALAGVVLAVAPCAQVPPPETPPQRTRPADDWLGADKATHAGVSFALAAGGALALRAGMDASRSDARALAVGTTLALGVTKEVADARRPRAPLFSWRDLAANAVGAALGALAASL